MFGRARFVVTVLGIGWTVLMLRLVQLQWWQEDRFADRAERQREYAEEIVPRPGDIVDRQGRLVATTLTMRSLYVVPSRIAKPWVVAQAIATALGISADSLFEKIGERTDRHFLWVKRRLARDSRGRVIEILDDTEHPPRAGESVQLALDLVVQLFAERELDDVMQQWKPESCCAVVLDPKTGHVLGMASRPTFDPNRTEAASADSWKNRAIADIYEPGSTFKPFLVSYGLDQGVLHKNDVFDCEHGQYRMGRRVLHDHHRYGMLNLTDVLVKSSNIGMAKIGERLTNERLFAAATLFGFGRKTGIELPGELSGILRPLKEWTSYSTGSIPMGHEVATTPLQLIVAHAALANGGQLLHPRIVLPRADDSTAAVRSIAETTVSPETAHWLIEGPMHEVITRGTGKRARVAGYNVFGKTGTAQCLSPHGGYVHNKYISSFVCGAPVEDPRLLVLVVVNQSSVGGETFGGKVAAPAAANILKQSLVYLRISPDEHLLETAANGKEDEIE